MELHLSDEMGLHLSDEMVNTLHADDDRDFKAQSCKQTRLKPFASPYTSPTQPR